MTTPAGSVPASLLEHLRRAQRVTILTGAGVSAASGIPTFRGAGGLWRSYRAEDLATAAGFDRDPGLVWEWYAWRRGLIAQAHPNAAHRVLAAWTRRWPGCTLVTQNVDDLHLRAGASRLVRLHGSIWDLACRRGCGIPGWRDEREPLPVVPPRCPGCGGVARPGVVWFGEALPDEQLAQAIDACACDVFVSAGTSALVYPAAGLIERARRAGAFTVELNEEETPASGAVDLAWRGRAEVLLERLEARLSGSDRRTSSAPGTATTDR